MKRIWMIAVALTCVGLGLSAPVPAQDNKVLRAGMIGLDTSHVVAFTKAINDGKNPDLAGVKMVAGYPGGSQDIAASRDRVEGFTKTLREKYGLEIVPSIDELVAKVDVVFLESVDGRPHLEQVLPVLKSGKPVFIDKPIAGSLADALRIFELSKQYKVPVFSSSSLRYYPGIAAARSNPQTGGVQGFVTWGPCSLEKTHPDLFWYGIHGVEALFTVMGTGCESVVRTHTADTDEVTGAWKDGRVGTFRGLRKGPTPFGGIVFGAKSVAPIDTKGGGYENLLKEVVGFFKTGKAPVSAEETIEIFAFMEAADESKRQGGARVTLASMLEKAKAENAKRRTAK